MNATISTLTSRSQPLLRTLSLCALLLVLLLGTGCDSSAMDDAESRTLAGVWKGTITHVNPDFNGTLTLTLTQAGDALGGTANWRFLNQGISGLLLGNSATLTYTLDFGEDGTYFHEATIDDGNTLTGRWASAKSSGINGTFSLQRQ